MLPYVIAAAVFAGGLVVAYRSLGGAALGPVESEAWIHRLLEMAEADVAAVDRLFALPGVVYPSATDVAQVVSETARNSVLEVAAQARKQLAGCQQHLIQLDLGDNAAMSAVTGLMTSALDDYVWACRLLQAGNVDANTGMAEAVASLQQHGRAALDQARATLSKL